MKDMVESAPLTNGEAVRAVKVAMNGEAVLQNGTCTAPASPDVSSTCSSDLQLHLPADSDDDGPPVESRKITDGPNNLENIHDPKASKLSATGANFNKMYKDSAEDSSGNVQSPDRKVEDVGLVESLTNLKSNSSSDGLELDDVNRSCASRTSNEPDEGSEIIKTMHLETVNVFVDKTLKQSGSVNSSDSSEEKTSIFTTWHVTNDVPKTIKESASECKETLMRKKVLDINLHKTDNSKLIKANESHEIDLKSNSASLDVPVAPLEKRMNGDNNLVTESYKVENEESTTQNVNSNKTVLENNEDPCSSLVVINTDRVERRGEFSFKNDCKDNEVSTVHKENNSTSFTEDNDKKSMDNCVETEFQAKCGNSSVLSIDKELISPLTKGENQERKSKSAPSLCSNVSDDEKVTLLLPSPKKKGTHSGLVNDEPSSHLEKEDDFELKLELECSDDSQDLKSDSCSKSDKTVSNRLLKPGETAQNPEDENLVFTLEQKDSVAFENDKNKVSIVEEINEVTDVREPKLSEEPASVTFKKDEPNLTEIKEIDVLDHEETTTPNSLSTEKNKPSVTTGPDNDMDLSDTKEIEALVNYNNSVSDNGLQTPLAPGVNISDKGAVKLFEKDDKSLSSVLLDNENEPNAPTKETVGAKSTDELCVKDVLSNTASALKMTITESNIGADKSEIISETNSVSDLDKDSNKTTSPPKPKVEDNTKGKAEVINSESESFQHAIKQTQHVENCSLKMETVADAIDDSVSISGKLGHISSDLDAVEEDSRSSCSTHKSDSSCEPKEINNVKKINSLFDKLLSNKTNETAESDCTTSRKSTLPRDCNGESEAKENDAPIADVQRMSTGSIDLEDGSDEMIVSSEKDDSRGFSGIGQKRLSSANSPVESKRPKLVNSHRTDFVKEVQSQSASLKRSLEISETSDSKKPHVGSAQVPTTKSSEHVSKKLEEGASRESSSTSSQSSRKSLSNIDKAIERVAFAGLDRKERIMMPFIKDLKNKRLRDITVDDLEELVTQRIAEVLSDTGENGVLREKVQKLERMTEFWKHKATSLQKQLSDMTMVFKKLATETKQNSSQMQIPIKITRSVGLQVMMPQAQSVGKHNSTQVRNGLPPGTKRKSGGIMTNRNTNPNVHYPSPNAVVPSRPPLVQKVVAPPIPTSTPIKVPQAVTTVKSPVIGPPPAAVRFRSPSSVVTNVITTGTVTTATSNLRTVPSVANRPVVKPALTRPAGDMLIDLTDEDDKTKRVSSTTALPTTLRLAQFNSNPTGQGGTIRIVSPQQLTNSTTGVNGQRLAYMLPASAANAATGRLQLFTQQTSGNLRAGSVLAVRPNTQTLTLKNGTVISSATPSSAIIRTAAGGTFQQVVPRQPQMRSIQPANRLTNGQITRTSAVLAESPVNRPLVTVPSGHTQHPAPLPASPPELPSSPNWKKSPPRPDLKISKVDTRDQHGIILSWNMDHGLEHEEIASYQLYAYQENSGPPLTTLWKKVGDVKAMPLPMACTLTQFLEGNKYHFAVRAVDIHSRCGMFSIPGHIILPRRVAS